MNIIDWAEKEIEIACKREAPDKKDGEWDYGCVCYESALKAYKSLVNDGHSGCSFGLTMNILNRLANGKPLTLIEDREDVWNTGHTRNGKTTYQCLRMSSLFKDVYEDGVVKYHDIDRVTCYDMNNPKVPFYYGVVSRLLDEKVPVTLPYSGDEHWKVYVEQFKRNLDDRNKNDWDTEAIYYAENNKGEKVEFNIFRKIPDEKLFTDCDYMKQISKHEFECIKSNVIKEMEIND